MRRIACTIVVACLLAPAGLIETANAGERHGGYYVRHFDGHRYKEPRYYDEPSVKPRESRSYSSCCYRKVTRYEKVDRDYPRTGDYHHRDYPRRSYYADPYVRPHRYTRRYDHGRYHYRRPYYSGPRIVYSNKAHLLRYSRHYGYGCYGKSRIKVPDGRGGWVWAYRLGC